jgi:hypothetical protein
MWPAWNQTAIAAAIVTAVLLVTHSIRGRGWEPVRALAHELVVVLVLYSIWQWVQSLSLTKYGNAYAHGRWIHHIERVLHLPGELALQHEMVKFHAITWFADLYYATVHAPALGLFLLWMWFRHRDAYPRWRNNLALVTGACLLIQLIPLAPPRMFPEFGFIDTLDKFGPINVYGSLASHGLSDQVGAMPSVHCAWALLVGFGIVTVSTSKWRWLFLAHPVITFLAVAATGNHWWLDGIVAGVLLGVSALLQWMVVGAWRWAGARIRGRADHPQQPDRSDREPALVLGEV